MQTRLFAAIQLILQWVLWRSKLKKPRKAGLGLSEEGPQVGKLGIVQRALSVEDENCQGVGSCKEVSAFGRPYDTSDLHIGREQTGSFLPQERKNASPEPGNMELSLHCPQLRLPRVYHPIQRGSLINQYSI